MVVVLFKLLICSVICAWAWCRANRLPLNALNDHLLGASLGADLGLDLVAVPGGDFTAPGVGAVVLVDPAGGGVGHGELDELG